MAETSYAKCGDLSLAYQVFGDGPVELVVVAPLVSHVELFCSQPDLKAFFDQLATFCRVLVFDKAGVGLSDPIPHVRTLDDRAAEIEAVMDAVGFGKTVLFALGEGGPAAIVFAATRPERTRALVLAGTTAYHVVTGWDDIDRDPDEVRARVLAELGEDYAPSVEQLARVQEVGRAVRSAWGSGAAFRVSAPSVGSIRQLAMWERMCASPGMARATLEAAFRIDVRPILPTISAPTLVIHAREDPIPVQCGRYLADHIAGARYLEVDGVDAGPWRTETDRILTAIEEFLTGSHATPAPSRRALRSVLFTDMVASTQHAAAAGDERWRAVLQRFGEITAEHTQQFGGTVVKSTGDGHLTTYDGPTQAIRCAEAIRADAETLGIQIRAGIHTGECELLDADIGGIAVHIAARILSQAGTGEILVSRTVRDLVVGSGTGFEDRGNVELRGVPGTWQLLAVDRHGPRTGSAEAELVSMPTPGRRTAMRRSDRAIEAIGRRAPWILRGMARLAPAAAEQRYVEPQRGLRPHTVRNSDRCNVRAGRPRLASVSEAKTSFTKSVPAFIEDTRRAYVPFSHPDARVKLSFTGRTRGAGRVSNPDGLRVQNDSVVAVDVVLEPDQTMTVRARGVNARLLAVYPEGFALDADHQPHVTMLQRFVRAADLNDLYAAANNVFASEDPTAWTLTASKAYYIPSPPIGLAGIVVEPTDDLLRLQQKLIDAITPYTVPTGTVDAFASTQQGRDIQEFLVQYVATFAPAASGENFNPHVTTGAGPQTYLDEMMAEPFEAFTFSPVGASAYQLGTFGTAQNKLAALTLKPSEST